MLTSGLRRRDLFDEMCCAATNCSNYTGSSMVVKLQTKNIFRRVNERGSVV